MNQTGDSSNIIQPTGKYQLHRNTKTCRLLRAHPLPGVRAGISWASPMWFPRVPLATQQQLQPLLLASEAVPPCHRPRPAIPGCTSGIALPLIQGARDQQVSSQHHSPTQSVPRAGPLQGVPQRALWSQAVPRVTLWLRKSSVVTFHLQIGRASCRERV